MRNSKWLLALLTAIAAMGQTAAPDADGKPATVDGVVTNAVTGEPVPRAHVTLNGFTTGQQKTFGAVSKADGTFSMPGLPPGTYYAAAQCTGYSPLNNFGPRDLVSMRVGPGDTKSDLKLKLMPNGSISGRVLDSDGEPIEQASVVAEGAMSSGSADTDDKGQFRIGGLAPGKYHVRAKPQAMQVPPEIRTDGTVEVHYARTWFSGSLDEKGATRVQVAAGAEVSGIEIRLIQTRITHVKGKVEGIPAGAQGRMLQIRQGTGTTGSQLNPDGTFEMWRLDPGKYTLMATWGTPGGQFSHSAPTDIEVADSDIDNIVLRYIPPADIHGVVQFDDEQAKPPAPTAQQGAQKGGFSRMGPARLVLQPPNGAYMGPHPNPADVSQDGSFTFEQAGPDRYRVVPTWGPVYIKSIRLGDAETEGDVLDLRNGGGAAVTIVVSSAVAQVSGTVTDSNGPVAGATVVLVPPDLGSRALWAHTGQDGTYSVTGIVPGPYKIAIVDVDEAAAVMRGKGLQESDQTADTITLQTGDKITKDLKK
jgi:protocatechuate 3,4-dioxygenase beta subunit